MLKSYKTLRAEALQSVFVNPEPRSCGLKKEAGEKLNLGNFEDLLSRRLPKILLGAERNYLYYFEGSLL